MFASLSCVYKQDIIYKKEGCHSQSESLHYHPEQPLWVFVNFDSRFYTGKMQFYRVGHGQLTENRQLWKNYEH